MPAVRTPEGEAAILLSHSCVLLTSREIEHDSHSTGIECHRESSTSLSVPGLAGALLSLWLKLPRVLRASQAL